jgi:hypothetical protein
MSSQARHEQRQRRWGYPDGYGWYHQRLDAWEDVLPFPLDLCHRFLPPHDLIIGDPLLPFLALTDSMIPLVWLDHQIADWLLYSSWPYILEEVFRRLRKACEKIEDLCCF